MTVGAPHDAPCDVECRTDMFARAVLESGLLKKRLPAPRLPGSAARPGAQPPGGWKRSKLRLVGPKVSAPSWEVAISVHSCLLQLPLARRQETGCEELQPGPLCTRAAIVPSPLAPDSASCASSMPGSWAPTRQLPPPSSLIRMALVRFQADVLGPPSPW